ncbi:metal/formaldehyde-sensitive transcriptional repressor [Sphingomonas adhaesiva]|uniref:metal/formaldehyde-sensitive transcriptional repressor n=1 Tax=Sphingomonas adhaesiva TaxID=28212 RepID=UPI002FFB349C
MSHLTSNTDALQKRVRRIVGQLQAVDRALAVEEDCATTLHLVAAVRGAVNGLVEELIEAHLREHVAAADLSPSQRDDGAEALMTAIRRYAK